MASLFHRARRSQHNSAEGNGARLVPPDCTGLLTEEYDPRLEGDLTYEDALTDLQIRRFMQSEYGSVEPPAGVLQRLMRALRAESAGAQRAQVIMPATLNLLLMGVYRRLTGPATLRLVPALVATMLVLVVLGANTTEMIGGSARQHLYADVSAQVTPEANLAVEPFDITTNRDERYTLKLSTRQEAAPYDPAEYRSAYRVRNSQSNAVDSTPTPYDRGRSSWY
jgi:hypothetical protein